MDPIFRRSAVLYVSHLLTYSVLMGRFMITRDWTAFEIIPLFMPVWLASAVLFSERDESYAFLRTLPVPDRAVARTKFRLILSSAVIQWLLMVGAALLRRGDGVSGPSTLVYVTLICACALLVAGCFQVGVWRYGTSAMTGVIGGFMGLGLVLIILHMISLKRIDSWPAFSQAALVQWLGRAPWVSSVVLAALALWAFHWVARAGVRVKASSEACL
jgi:hypothetical protein